MLFHSYNVALNLNLPANAQHQSWVCHFVLVDFSIFLHGKKFLFVTYLVRVYCILILERVHIFQVKTHWKFFDKSEKKVKAQLQLCLMASWAIAIGVILYNLSFRTMVSRFLRGSFSLMKAPMQKLKTKEKATTMMRFATFKGHLSRVLWR